MVCVGNDIELALNRISVAAKHIQYNLFSFEYLDIWMWKSSLQQTFYVKNMLLL